MAKTTISKKKSHTRLTKVTPKKHEMIDESMNSVLPAMYPSESQRPATTRWGMLVGILILVVGIYATSKGYVVAAIVNGKPVFRWTVSQMLANRYGKQTLESIISEQLIADAAKSQGVQVTQKDIDAKTNEVVTSLGPNVKLDDLLKYQGMNKAEFEHQISLQLTVEKILGKDVSVTDAEVTEFIEKNKETMVATEEAAMKGEAREALTSQKMRKFSLGLQKLKETAKVVRLMK
jgi:foldase protein PrsA